MEHVSKAMALPAFMMTASTSKTCKHEYPGGYTKEFPLYKASELRGFEQFGDKLICLECIREGNNDKFQQDLQAETLERQSTKRKNTLYKRSIFSDQTIADAGFKNFKVSTDEEQANKAMAKLAVDRYKELHEIEANEYFTTMLTGSTGVGKSHLAMAILRNLNETLDVECVFINVRYMLQHIKDSFNNKESIYTQMYFIDLLSRVDFLVLDDLGNETGDKEASRWVKEVLTEVLESRQNKATIITTNYKRGQLERMYGSEYMERSALISRLLKNTAPIVFKDTNDKRVKVFDLTAPIKKEG